MKKRPLINSAFIVLIVAAVLTLSGCPQPTAASPGTITVNLSNAEAVTNGVLLLVGVFNTGDDPQTADPLGSAATPIISGAATDIVNDGALSGAVDVIFPAGTYQFSAMVDLDGDYLPTTGDKAVLITITIDGDKTVNLNYTGTGWISIP
jgi:hypothetical protein